MILILSIYNETPFYNKMREIQRKYVHSNSNIKYYFITFRNQEQRIECEDDMIYCRGEEGFHTIILKTLMVLQYLIQEKKQIFDYVIRTNVSTLIQYSVLLRQIESLPRSNIYIGGNVMELKWCKLDNPDVVKHQLYGLNFVQGSSIVWSYDVVCHFLNRIDEIPKNLSDDVAFAVFIRDKDAVSYESLAKHKLSFVSASLKHMDGSLSEIVFFRNRVYPNYEMHEDRSQDIEMMDQIVKRFLF